jgi:hypothetical protein
VDATPPVPPPDTGVKVTLPNISAPDVGGTLPKVQLPAVEVQLPDAGAVVDGLTDALP